MTAPKDADAVREHKLGEEATIVRAYCARSCSALEAAFTAPVPVFSPTHDHDSPLRAHALPVFPAAVFTEPLPNTTCKLVLENLKSDANTAVPSAFDAVGSGFKKKPADPSVKPRKQTIAVTYVSRMSLGDPVRNKKGVTPDQTKRPC